MLDITQVEKKELKKRLSEQQIDADLLVGKLIESKKVLMICGPTCVGKSKTGINLAYLLGTDIISIDSMQIYKGMDIGTDKVDTKDLGIKQYMVSLFEPDRYVTAVEFKNMCRNIIENQFFKKKKIPILVGGSGLYMRAVLDKLDFAPQRDKEIRKKIKEEIRREGLDNAYSKLKQVDPGYSKKIGPNDERRIIRALEVYRISGKPYSNFQKTWKKWESIYDVVFIGLNKHRESLYKNINNRVDLMFEKGLVKEVEKLNDKGYKDSYSVKQAVGYKEVISHLEGEMSYGQCIDEVKKNTRRLAKKQLTWFRNDPRINWIRVDNYDNILSLKIDITKLLYNSF